MNLPEGYLLQVLQVQFGPILEQVRLLSCLKAFPINRDSTALDLSLVDHHCLLRKRSGHEKKI
jgi:hypothetical protein